jgi:hypothetical protein
MRAATKTRSPSEASCPALIATAREAIDRQNGSRTTATPSATALMSGMRSAATAYRCLTIRKAA